MRLVVAALALVGACADRTPSPPATTTTATTTAPGPAMTPHTAPVVTARLGAVELSASAAGPVVHVVLRNRGELPLTLYAAAEGEGGHPRHHDFLTAEVDGGRTLHLAGARNSSTTGLVDLAPGAETADDLDLAAWAADAVNGAVPLVAGDHDVTLVYEVAGQAGVWNGALRAGPLRIHVR